MCMAAGKAVGWWQELHQGLASHRQQERDREAPTPPQQGLQPAVTFSSPGSRGWSLLYLLLPGPEGQNIAFQAGRGSLAEAALPGWLSLQDGGAGPGPGHSPGLAAVARSQQGGGGSATPSQEGWLPVPAADATPQPICQCQPCSLATATEGTGGAQLQPAPTTPRTQHRLGRVEVRARPAPGTAGVAFASLKETQHCSGNTARPVIFPSHLQPDQFSF